VSSGKRIMRRFIKGIEAPAPGCLLVIMEPRDLLECGHHVKRLKEIKYTRACQECAAGIGPDPRWKAEAEKETRRKAGR